MMEFTARYRTDGAIEGVSIVGGEFARNVEWSRELLAAADPSFLSFDGSEITLTVDQGVATYRVLGSGRSPDSLSTRLRFVVHPDGTRERWALHDVMGGGGAPDA